MYILEVYTPLVAASAIAALGLLRYVLAMAFPLFTVDSMFPLPSPVLPPPTNLFLQCSETSA